MASKYFWNIWPRPVKATYLLLIFLAIITVLYYSYSIFEGLGMVIDWEKFAFYQELPVVLDTIKNNAIEIKVEVLNLLILQNFKASPLEVNVMANYLFCAVAAVCFIFFLSICTYLHKIWFFAAIGLWVVIISALRLELLFSNFDSYIALAIVGLPTVITAYYFNAFRSHTLFLVRVLIFFVIFSLLGIVIFSMASHSHPFLFIASNALIPLLLITIIFTFLVAHEIIAAFIYILTSNAVRGEGKNHIHFLIISVIYLGNILLLYLNNIGKIDWDIWYISPYLLLVISFILGIWGFRNREAQYQHIISFAPLGAFYYQVLSVLGFSTIAFLHATSNDPALEVIEEAIIFGHLGFGIIFLFYIVSNFSKDLTRGENVHEGIYNPQSMPFFIYRFAGTIAVFAFVIIGNWEVPLHYTVGAYFNQQGDLAKVQEEEFLQQGYLQQSRIYAYNNHHANYSLANYFEEQQENGKASSHYINAINRTPSAQAYINLSRIYQENNRFFDALFALQEGANVSPHGTIFNNLGVHYSRINILDSAFYFLEKATMYDVSESVALANMEALIAANDLSVLLDSLDFTNEAGGAIALNNKVVRFNNQRKYLGKVPEYLYEADSNNFVAAGLAYNFLINSRFQNDTSNLQQILNTGNKFTSSAYGDNIQYGLAISEYYHHRVQDAFRRLNLLANHSYGDAARYFNTLGKWSLEQNAPDQAVRFFNQAIQVSGEFNALYPLSLALNNRAESAINILNSNASPDSIGNILSKKFSLANKAGNDLEMLNYIQFHLEYFDSLQFHEFYQKIINPNIKAKAVLTFSQKQYYHGQEEDAVTTYGKITGIKVTDSKLYEEILYYELKLLAATGQIMNLAGFINEHQIEFSFEKFPEKIYYKALVDAVSGDSTSALQGFKWIAANQPFMESEVAISAGYIQNFVEDPYTAYNLLLSALEINPNSVILMKAYIMEAVRLGLEKYASGSLDDLRKHMHPDHFASFKKEYEALLQEKLTY